MKYYVIKGDGDDIRNYTPLFKVLKKYRVIYPTLKMVVDPPKVPINSIVVGFSLGALVGFSIAQKQPIKKLVACSMSPFLGKDIAKLPKYMLQYILKYNDGLKRMNYSNILAQKAIFMCADQDVALIRSRTLKLGGEILKNTKHKLTKKYTKEILKCLK